METDATFQLITRRYHEVHGACLPRTFDSFISGARDSSATAALGYRSARHGRLYLERYLEVDVEVAVSSALGFEVAREDIVELGNLAAANGMAMVELWAQAANDLGSASQVAVATLTAPLRAMFTRIGLPLVELAPALPDAVEDAAEHWGTYYDSDPRVCVGLIAEGQQAIARYFAPRCARRAA